MGNEKMTDKPKKLDERSSNLPIENSSIKLPLFA